nr:hypothetical protein BgiMline_006517 [Biomphalaria glabrata]
MANYNNSHFDNIEMQPPVGYRSASDRHSSQPGRISSQATPRIHIQAEEDPTRLQPRRDGNIADMNSLSHSVRSDKSLLSADHPSKSNSSLNKGHSLSSEDLMKLERFETLRVSFIDRKKGVEYDANGDILPPSSADDTDNNHGDYYPEDYPDNYPDNYPEDQYQTSPDGYASPTEGRGRDSYGNYNYSSDHPPAYPTSYNQGETPGGRADYQTNGSSYAYGSRPEWQGGTFNPSPADPTFSTRQNTGPKIPNYIHCSIVVAFLFFFPVAVIATMYAVKAFKMKNAGRHAEAKALAKRALHLNILAVVLGVIGYGVTGFMIWYNVKRIEKYTG